MGTFQLYISLGWEHLTDFGGYDHMLFLLALVLGYSYKNWKALLTLVTAFTVGHSIALALAVFKIVTFNSNYIEYGILLSIAALALKRFLTADVKTKSNNMRFEYILVLFFGVIHGLGFSNYLSAILSNDVWKALLGFNLGLEIAQVVFVSIVVAILSLVYHFISDKNKLLINRIIAAIVVVWSVVLIIIK